LSEDISKLCWGVIKLLGEVDGRSTAKVPFHMVLISISGNKTEAMRRLVSEDLQDDVDQVPFGDGLHLLFILFI